MQKSFYHENLDVKQKFLHIADEYDELSRQGDDEMLKGAYTFASALLFMNHADYIAQWFAYNMRDLVDVAVEDYYGQQVTISRKQEIGKSDHISIGDSISIIKRYEFSNKQKLISILKDISDARNNIAHQIVKTKPEDFRKFDNDYARLRDKTRELIKFTDQFKTVMPPKNLRDVLSKGQ